MKASATARQSATNAFVGVKLAKTFSEGSTGTVRHGLGTKEEKQGSIGFSLFYPTYFTSHCRSSTFSYAFYEAKRDIPVCLACRTVALGGCA
jgi:hypothetical protein